MKHDVLACASVAMLAIGANADAAGNPARSSDDHRARLVTLRRPSDGWSWGLTANEEFER